jgi:hypothetical protein
MVDKSYKLTVKEMCDAVEAIMARGNDAEVRRAAGGQYIVYEVKKKKVRRQDVGAAEKI